MLYIKNKIFTLSFECRPSFNIQVIDFINGNINIIDKINYTYINGKCNLQVLKDYITTPILNLNFNIENMEYGIFIDGKMVYKDKEIVQNIKGKIVYKESELINNSIEGKLDLKYNKFKRNLINGKIIYKESELIDNSIEGKLDLKDNKFERNLINGKMCLQKEIYDNILIDGKIIYKDREYKRNMIDVRYLYKKGELVSLIDGKMEIERKDIIKDIDIIIHSLQIKDEIKDIKGKLVYNDYSKLKKDIDVVIYNMIIKDEIKDIKVNMNYKEKEIKRDIDGKLVLGKEKLFKYFIKGKLNYEKKDIYENCILGKLNYIDNGYIRLFFDGRLVLDNKQYINDLIKGKLNLEELRYENDIMGKLNLEERCMEMILPLRFKIKYKCYFYSIFGKVNVMDEEKRDICGRIYIEENKSMKDIFVNLKLDMYKFWNDDDGIKNERYIISYENNAYNNEIMVKIRNVKNDNIMEEYRKDIEVNIKNMEKEKEYKKDIEVNMNIINNIYLWDKNYRKEIICKYYREKDGLCLMGDEIKKCNNTVLCGKITNVINRYKEELDNHKFEIECDKYDICDTCIMEYEKRIRNIKRKEELQQQFLFKNNDIIVEKNSGIYNVLSDKFDYDIKKKNELSSDIPMNNKQWILMDENKLESIFGILIYVDEKWVVDPYVFKSCLISVLERYYGNCDDMYVYYGGNIRTNFDVVNLCLNYKISLERIKKIEGDIDYYIRTGFCGDIRKAYIFMNDPYNWNNNMKIRRIVNICRDINIDVVVIGNGGEYIVLDGMDWNYVDPDIIINNNDTNKIVY